MTREQAVELVRQFNENESILFKELNSNPVRVNAVMHYSNENMAILYNLVEHGYVTMDMVYAYNIGVGQYTITLPNEEVKPISN